jgi:Protein of unknown function (DUF3592)
VTNTIYADSLLSFDSLTASDILGPLANITFLGIEAPVWTLILFAMLLFGIPHLRLALRFRALPSWPTTTAIVTHVSPGRATPAGSSKSSARLGQSVVSYEYKVGGISYTGWFAVMTGEDGDGSRAAATDISQEEVVVRYDPQNPKDSVPAQNQLLGRKVLQEQNWLNPRAW